MLTNLILWVRTTLCAAVGGTRTVLMATPSQWASQKLSDKEICDAIITTMNNPHNNYDLY